MGTPNSQVLRHRERQFIGERMDVGKTSKVNVVSKEGAGNNDTGRVGIEGEEGRKEEC